jgi:hypothetical protein
MLLWGVSDYNEPPLLFKDKERSPSGKSSRDVRFSASEVDSRFFYLLLTLL